jgi:glycosyltransferase involved in cell wall biosynthesis
MSSIPSSKLMNDHHIISAPVPSLQRPKLRICMLAYAFYETDTRILQYATSLVERGDIVDVIALKRDPRLPDFEQLDGVNLYRIQNRILNEKGIFSYVSRIARFALRSALFIFRNHNEHPYDVVHVHNVPDFLVFSAIYPKLRGGCIVLDIHDLLPEFYASKFNISHNSPIFKALVFTERCSAAFANHVIIANHLWRDRLASRSSAAEKCSVVRNRPDLSIFTKQKINKLDKDQKFIITYPGSLNWHQGLDVAIRAFAIISDRIPEAEFHIYGEGSAKASLIALVDELAMANRIFFHIFLPSRDIAKVMANTDLAVEPKRSNSAFGNEALSTKILEFMSLGVPVIASRTTIHAYYYDESIIQYYNNDDEFQLAEQILRFRNNPELRRSLAENAKQYLEQNTWDARKHEYLQLIDSLINPNLQIALVL